MQREKNRIAVAKHSPVCEKAAFDEAGKSVFSPSQNGGYFSYKYKGEPIKNHTYLSLAEAALIQWMNSKGHRANILRGFAYQGCGGYLEVLKNQDQFPKFRLTQNFATEKE